MAKFSLKQNKKYWEDSNTKSLIDSNLKELEIAFFLKYLKKNHKVADIGCGDGTTSVRIAPSVKSVIALERSDYLRKLASKNILDNKIKNIAVVSGDILNMNFQNEFDVVITERVIINLPSWKHQKKAILNIHRSLKRGGIYLMIENTHEAHIALNKTRKAVGLKPIGLHWHNVFLYKNKLIKFLNGKFKIIGHSGFSLYYFLTRVYMQMFALFTGYGVKARAHEVFKLADPAAKVLHEKFNEQIIFKDNNGIIGSIQGFTLKKL